MSNYLNQVVHLTEQQYQTLITNGSITVNGQTVTYNPNDIYVTSQNLSYADNDSTQGDTLTSMVTKVTQAANGQIAVEKMPFPIIVKDSAGWASSYNLIASRGTLLIYTDRDTITETVNGTVVTKIIPGIKVADGSTPAIDLPFVGDDQAFNILSDLNDHINDQVRHITAAERTSWNNKITCDNSINNNNLILTRN